MYNRKKLDDQDNSKIENIAKLVPNGKKKWVRYDEGAVLYSMGINSFRQLAKDAKAIYRVNRIVLVNTEKVDEYLELMCADLIRYGAGWQGKIKLLLGGFGAAFRRFIFLYPIDEIGGNSDGDKGEDDAGKGNVGKG